MCDETDLNERQRDFVAQSLALLLALPWAERSDAFSRLRYNRVVCTDCGWGEIADPNDRCQCTNDE